MTETEFVAFLTSMFRHLAASQDGAIHFLCIDWRHMRQMLRGRHAYTELKNLCVWAKTNAGMGTFYRCRHELVCVWKCGTAAHLNNFEFGKHGRITDECVELSRG